MTKYPEIPSTVQVRSVPLYPDNGGSVAVPSWLEGDTATKEDHQWVEVGAEYITPYASPQEAWEDACYDAARQLGQPHTEVSYNSQAVQEVAVSLINSRSWWAV